MVGRKTEKVAKLLSNQSIQHLIQQGILVQLKKLQPKICEIKSESDTATTEKLPNNANNEDIEKNNIKTVKLETVQGSTCPNFIVEDEF